MTAPRLPAQNRIIIGVLSPAIAAYGVVMIVTRRWTGRGGGFVIEGSPAIAMGSVLSAVGVACFLVAVLGGGQSASKGE